MPRTLNKRKKNKLKPALPVRANAVTRRVVIPAKRLVRIADRGCNRKVFELYKPRTDPLRVYVKHTNVPVEGINVATDEDYITVGGGDSFSKGRSWRPWYVPNGAIYVYNPQDRGTSIFLYTDCPAPAVPPVNDEPPPPPPEGFPFTLPLELS